jgi:hypothetical protein
MRQTNQRNTMTNQEQILIELQKKYPMDYHSQEEHGWDDHPAETAKEV